MGIHSDPSFSQGWVIDIFSRESYQGLATFWFGAFAMFLAPLGVFFVMETLENER